MRILAISPFQNSSVAIVNDGTVECFYKEEQFSKIKTDPYPFLAIDYCVKNSPGKIDLALICSDTQTSNTIISLGAYLKKMHGITEIVDISENYHLQLASLAFYNSHFDKSLVVVIDNNGSCVSNLGREAETMFIADYPASFKMIYQSIQLFDKDSPIQGQYEDAYIEGNSMFGVSKIFKAAGNVCRTPLSIDQITALSAYGRADINFTNLYKLRNVPNSGLFHQEDETQSPVYLTYKDNKVEEISKENYQEFADFAFQMQIQTQNAVADMISIAIKQHNIKKVCVVGDFASNSIANFFYKKRFPELDFYFETLDYGNSIGGAYFFYRDQTGDGRLYSNKKIKPLIKSEPNDENLLYCQIKDIPRLIASNKSIAVFHNEKFLNSKCLGNRNILLNPCDPESKEKLKELTGALWFEHGRALILKEDAYDLFNIIGSISDNVSYTIKLNKKTQVPSIFHHDNSCQLTIIDDESSTMYKILQEIKKITGVGAVLTSDLKLPNGIVVETAQEALDVFDNSKIDAIWFPEFSKIKTKN